MSLFKVLDMMIGEVEYSRYFVEVEQKDPLVLWMGRWMFVTFCSIMSLALMNLLVSQEVLRTFKERGFMKKMQFNVG